MSNLICPECGSTKIQTEKRLDGFHHCMDCRHVWKIGESQPKPTNRDVINAMSNEELAKLFAYPCPPKKHKKCSGRDNEECRLCWLDYLNAPSRKRGGRDGEK